MAPSSKSSPPSSPRPDSALAPPVPVPPAGSTGSKGSKGSKAADKSFLSTLAAYWWVAAALVGVISLIIIIVQFYPEKKDDPRSETQSDSDPKAPSTSNTQPSTQLPLANQPQANVKANVKAYGECPSKQDGECMDNLVCIEAMEADAAVTGTNGTVLLSAQVKGKFYCKVAVGGECPSKIDRECVDHAVCARQQGGEWKCKALLGATCTGGVEHDCWQPPWSDSSWSGMPNMALVPTCLQGLCQVVAGQSGCFGKLVFERLVEGGQAVCKAGMGMRCKSPRGTALHDWCAKDLMCQTSTTFKAWTCQAASNSAAQIQLGETTDTWSRLMQSNLRKKRTQNIGFLQLDYD